MGTPLSNNLTPNTPKPLDDRGGLFASGTWRPYTSTTEANSTINSAYRYVGMTVYIGTPTNFQTYWYYGGVTDGNLIPKDKPVITTFNTAIPFDKEGFVMIHTATGDITFTVNSTNSTPLGGGLVILTTTDDVTFTGMKEITGSQPISSTEVNRIAFIYDGVDYTYKNYYAA